MAKYKYRVMHGSHVDENGEKFNGPKATGGTGDIVETDNPLHEMFAKGKFQLLAAPAQALKEAEEKGVDVSEAKPGRGKAESEKTSAKSQKAKAESEETDETEDEDSVELGDDVSDQFEAADAAGVSVYKSGKFYQLSEDGGETILDTEEMTRKDQVNEYLAAQYPQEEAEDE